MAKQLQYKRLMWLTLLVVLAFAGLAARLVDLQVLRHPQLDREARANTQHIYRFQPHRGDILDCNGNPLATSVFVKTVCADPTLLAGRQADVARVLAPLLGLSEAELTQRLTVRTRLNAKGVSVPDHYEVLKRKVSTDDWKTIRARMASLNLGLDEKRLTKKEKAILRDLREKSIYADPTDDQLRTYPNQALAGQLIGYTGLVERTNGGVRMMETKGFDGIEAAFDSKLKGFGGWRITERDHQQKEIVSLRGDDVEPRDGLNIVLTIDSIIQGILERALQAGLEKHTPASISGIVLRPKTGEILAMASLPSYNPNQPGASPDDTRRNRAIMDVAEPGSTFKIVVVSGALNEHTASLTDMFDCKNGSFYYAGRILRDHVRYGMLSVESIITKSSNIGAAEIAIDRLGTNRLDYYIHRFGFGAPTGIPLPGEVRGLVRDINKWSKLSFARIPMGQGIAVTSLQMAMAMGAIANHGVLMHPMIVAREVDQNGSVIVRYAPQAVRQVIDPAAAREMVQALKTVTLTGGTAPEAALEHYTVAGKTGTAQKNDGHRYFEDRYYSSFIGFFPADNPELLVYISVDDPKGGHFGGQVAAPLFKQVAEQAAAQLNIMPDRDTNGGLGTLANLTATFPPGADGR